MARPLWMGHSYIAGAVRISHLGQDKQPEAMKDDK
jgi:hypothetical protein